VRNIFLFIRRYFNFLLFLSLQVFSIYLIIHYNSFHNAVGSAYINEITGKVNTQYNRIEYYIQLRKTNDSLVEANKRLYNKLKIDFDLPDTTSKTVIDTLKVDSVTQYRKFNYLEAKVVYNSVALQSNFIEFERGTNGGIKKEMGVVDAGNNVVGIVTDVSDKYAVVMSLLNKDSKISAQHVKSKDVGTITWDGKEPNKLILTDIRKSAKISRGDSIITSGYTPTFPYGLFIGTVDEVVGDKSTNNYIIKVKSAANFYSLQFVYALEDLQKDEINKLLDKVKKQNQ
jgi:rod shape-determining protein MreC